MKLRYFFLLITLLPLTAVGQYNSRLGRFEVDEKKGCAPFTVTITDTNLITVGQCTIVSACDMTWGDGTGVQQNFFTHTYTQPGTYLLQILYQGGILDDIEITITPNTQPAFDIYTCGNREVQVKITDTNYDAYIINYNDATAEVSVPKGSLATDNHVYATAGPHTITVRGKDVNADDNCFPGNTKSVEVVNSLTAPFIDVLTVASGTQVDVEFNNSLYSDNVLYKLEIALNTAVNGSFQATANTFLNVSNGSISDLRTDDNFYCFRLGAFDPCLNSIASRSNIICSANFDVSPQNNVNNLTWNSSTTGVTNFTINRDAVLLGTTGALLFADNTVVCNTPYCYQLVTNYSNGSQSISLDKCATAISTDIPTAIENITAVVGSGTVDLTWLQDPDFVATEYKIFRNSSGGDFNFLTNTSTPQVNDDAYSTSNEYCYRINYTDACNNNSPDGTVEACPIRLSGKVNIDNSIELNWSDYSGWINGVDHYVIEKYDAQGVLAQTFNNIAGTTFTDNTSGSSDQIHKYIVKAEANDVGFGQAVSNEIVLIKELNLYYPTAFTPNNDNLNDVFLVFGEKEYMARFEMEIFNRWGELMFTTNSIDEGWDGKFRGTLQPEGTYVFVAKIKDLTGRTLDRSGSFVLLRKK